MKLLTEFSSAPEAEEASRLLEKNGIATYISSPNTSRILPFRGVTPTVGLWVVVPAQLADADALLANPHHVVQNPLTPEELTQIKSSVSSSDMTVVLNFLFKMLTILLLIVAGIFALSLEDI